MVWSPVNELVSVDLFGHAPEIPDRQWLGRFRSFANALLRCDELMRPVEDEGV